ncbi:hypothetical protein CRG98_029034, partial [Punica granatum]
FTFLLRNFAEPARSCLLQASRVCSPVRVNYSASQVRRACSLVPLATLTGLLTRASLLFCFASSSSLLARASCNLDGSAHPCEFTFLLRKFVELAHSCLLQPCPVFSPVRVYFCSSLVRRACSLLPLATLKACSLVPLVTLPGLLTRASLLFFLEWSSSLLAPASCKLPGSAYPCEFTFLFGMVVEPARSCLLQASRVCLPVRVYFSGSQVRPACSLLPLATMPGLLTRAGLLLCFASSPSLHARVACNLAGSAQPCEFTFLLRKLADHARSCLLQSCRDCSPVRIYFSASHVRRAYSLVPLATLPGLLNRASLLFCFASWPTMLAPASCNLAGTAHLSSSLLARASCNLDGSAHPCEFTFLLRKFVELAPSCLLQPCPVCSPVRVYFCPSLVRRACSLLLLATLMGLLTRASLIFWFASSPSLLTPASCNLAGSAHPCEFTFLLCMFAEPTRSCLLQPCRVCSPVRVYFSALHVRRAYSLVPLATLPGLLTCASLLYFLAWSSSLLARASCNLAGSSHPCEFTFLLRNFAEPARSCLLQASRVCSPVRVYFSALHVRRAYSLVPLATLPGLLTHASLLFCFACSTSLLARASCNLAGSAHPCEFTFLVRKFAQLARSYHLQLCLVCSP